MFSLNIRCGHIHLYCLLYFSQELERIEQLLRGENGEEEDDDECDVDEGEFEEVQEEGDEFEDPNAFDEPELSGMGMQGMQSGHSLIEGTGSPFEHSGAGFAAYGGVGRSGFSGGSVNSAEDSDLQRALSQSLLDPYGGGGPGEDSSGFEDDGVMYASLDNSVEGPSTPRRWS